MRLLEDRSHWGFQRINQVLCINSTGHEDVDAAVGTSYGSQLFNVAYYLLRAIGDVQPGEPPQGEHIMQYSLGRLT